MPSQVREVEKISRKKMKEETFGEAILAQLANSSFRNAQCVAELEQRAKMPFVLNFNLTCSFLYSRILE